MVRAQTLDMFFDYLVSVLTVGRLDDAIDAGGVTIDGDRSKLGELVSYLDSFEFWFNIVTP